MVAVTDQVDYNVEQSIAVITINNPPVNALSHGVREGIYKGIETASQDDSVTGIVIYCEGRTFIAVLILVNLEVLQRNLICLQYLLCLINQINQWSQQSMALP